MSVGVKGVCLVAGAGPGIGQSVARVFCRQGFTVVAVRRREHQLQPLVTAINREGEGEQWGPCQGLACDLRREDEVARLVDRVEAEVGPIECAVHNIGANIGHVALADTSTRVFTKVWELAALSAFLLCREAGARMQARGRGSILVTGATASVRGGAGFSAFSSAMMAKRAVAQSAARELGPRGVHVAHVVVDGVVDNPNTEKFFAEKDEKFSRLFAEKSATAGLIRPESVAELYHQLHAQDKSVWTHELDIRPWIEKW